VDQQNSVLKNAWNTYYQLVEEARSLVEATSRFQRPEHQAQAYHSLLEAQSMAFNQIMAPRLNHPRVYTHTLWNPTLLTLGQNSGDCLYSLLALHGKQTYRVRARLGDVKLMLMQPFSNSHGQPDCKEIGNFDVSKFAPSPDGSYDIVFSAEKHDGNWIPLAGESNYNYVLVRRWFVDWFDDMGDLSIEMTGELAGYDEQSPEAMAERIVAAGRFVLYQIKEFTIRLYDMYIEGAGGKNKFFYFPGKSVPELIGSSFTPYICAIADCEPDEAVIVEWTPPNAAYWGFQLGDVWSKPLENVFNQADTNMKRAAVDSDGKVRVVISHKDTGLQNWMDPVGRTEFNIVVRDYREMGTPVGAPTLKRVKLSELSAHLPADTGKVTPEQRRKDLEHRRLGNASLYDTIHSAKRS